jgi:hypothetical protein
MSRGAAAEMPLTALRSFTGRRGVSETFYRQRFEIEASEEVGLRFAAPR